MKSKILFTILISFMFLAKSTYSSNFDFEILNFTPTILQSLDSCANYSIIAKNVGDTQANFSIKVINGISHFEGFQAKNIQPNKTFTLHFYLCLPPSLKNDTLTIQLIGTYKNASIMKELKVNIIPLNQTINSYDLKLFAVFSVVLIIVLFIKKTRTKKDRYNDKKLRKVKREVKKTLRMEKW